MSEPAKLFKPWQATICTGLLMIAAAVLAWVLQIQTPSIFLSVGLFVALVGLAWFDFDHYRIPNWISYPLILAGLGLAYAQPELSFAEHLIGAGLGYTFVWGLNAYWRYARGQDGIGMGDAKLFAAAGAWLGALALPFVSLFASASALLVLLLIRLITGKDIGRTQRIAFGPFIAIGFWMAWLSQSLWAF